MELDIFKALSDPSRRKLLDLLYQSDGRTLSELCTHLEMTRFGVMKHLNILEEADLILTRKVGREKLHYLNAVPIREMYDRWVSKYTEPWVSALTQLKMNVESEAMLEHKPKHIHRIAIKSAPEHIWRAITDPSMTAKFWYNGSIRAAQWKAGGGYEIWSPEGKMQAKGELLVVEPPHKLVMSWQLLSLPDTAEEGPSRLTWDIVPHSDIAGVTLVTVTHDEYAHAPNTSRVLEGGLPVILSGLKTWLETGKTLSEA
ncbi:MULTISPECIES: ArsR/SmtB family transcription factor [Paenibacillus]|uniref:ArsR/SmtB family transcription factor n=1 Tax=Paenibacillus TaxID=44249 RepID=UPI0022B89D2B|nr:metalloregulator ArsR/SmtB family transcription factor [Paenibacillus caseinilyticus]MCZ8522425.1 metalloregulator ArsR/SmtB family transcription factor [Paenibacillus caseinilyticus]